MLFLHLEHKQDLLEVSQGKVQRSGVFTTLNFRQKYSPKGLEIKGKGQIWVHKVMEGEMELSWSHSSMGWGFR